MPFLMRSVKAMKKINLLYFASLHSVVSIGFNCDQPIFVIIVIISTTVEGGLACNNIKFISFFLGSVELLCLSVLVSGCSAKSKYLKEF